MNTVGDIQFSEAPMASFLPAYPQPAFFTALSSPIIEDLTLWGAHLPYTWLTQVGHIMVPLSPTR